MKQKIDFYIGKRLKIRRSLLGLSQKQLAVMVQFTLKELQNYEEGSVHLSASDIYKLSKVLEVPLMYFYTDFRREEISKQNHQKNKEGSSYFGNN